MFLSPLFRAVTVTIPMMVMVMLAPAQAALIGNSLQLPLIPYRNVNIGATNYDEETDKFSLTTGELTFFDGTPPVVITNGQLNLNIVVDDTGALVMNPEAQDLTISGDVTISGTPYSGTLLSGKVSAFGFDNSDGNTDDFDFQVSNLTGPLAALYPSGLGIELISESSNFNGNFMLDFKGRAKGTLGGIDLPPLKAALGDFVWEDLNMNGIQDNGEPGIAGVRVNLLSPGNDMVCNSADDVFAESTLTDASGMYGFSNLDAGDYCVEFEAPTDYVFSPQNVGSDTSDSDADPTTGKTTTISLAPGDNDLTWDAGLYLEVIKASLGDFVWEDLDEDGIQDMNEPGIENVIVNLLNPGSDNMCGTGDESVNATTTTNTQGIYGFVDLNPGQYCVEFIAPTGYVISPQNVGANDAIDSDADPVTGQTSAITLNAGDNDLSWDLGVYQPVLNAMLGNFVWLDLNMDGIQDGNELGIEDVIVNLLTPGFDNMCNTGDEIFNETTETDIDGIYGFINLDPGEYCVQFIKPAGFVFSPQNTTVNALDSDADQLTGQTATITLAAGDNDLTWDAGVFPRPLAKLGDRVWNDINADGIQNCTDNGDGIIGGPGDIGPECNTGIANVNVTLVLNPNGDNSCNGVELTTTTTDAEGFYVFNDLDPDLEYCVRFDQVSANDELFCDDIINPGIGAQFSPVNQGMADASDSDADVLTGLTGNISLNSGDFDRTWDAGFYCPAKIGDRLIEDRNRDGIQGDLIDEPGIDGQPVQLVECVAGVPGTTIIDSTTTANGGMYMFNPLPPGEYAVIFSKLGDTQFSPQDQGGNDDTDCDTNLNGHTQCLTLAPNEYNSSVDACVNLPPAGLGNFVFEDKDVDGIQDASEPGIDGVTVNLLLPGLDGTCNTTDDVMMAGPNGTTTTTGNGGYEFTGLNPGTYCVQFDITSIPADFCTTDNFALGAPRFTLRNEGTDATADSDADPLTGKTANIVLVANQFDPKNDAGIYCPAKIGDRVWEDTNSNGLQDSTEIGVPGVEVKLFECGADGIAGTTDDVYTGQSRFTDNNDGRYMFGAEPGVFDLTPGNYFVQFDKPFGSQYTTPGVGTDEAIDSNCMANNGNSSCVSLTSRGINLSRDCGLTPPPPPNCDLMLEQTCLIETPPPPTFDKCNGKLQEFTVTWTGGDINIDGLPNDTVNGDVTTNQEVTFYGPFDTNDVFINITGAVKGQSKFHMSCSDDDFNSPDDCGKLSGNAKSTSGFINEWELEGFIDDDNTVLNCTSDTSGNFPVQESCSFIPEVANCETLGKPTSLTFKYNGAGCAASDNDQGTSKSECIGDVNGMLSVAIVAGKNDLSDIYTVSPASVAPGGEFTVTADGFQSDSRINITNAGGTESNRIHMSCSVPLAVGDKYGSLELVGFNGVNSSTEVQYGYTVTNNGDPITDVSIVDSRFGTIADMLNFDMYQTRQFTQLGNVSATTTSIASVKGILANGDQCQASDELTVKVVEPLIPVTCSDIKPLTELSMVWDGPDGVNIAAASGQQFNNVQNGNRITFGTVGLGNDVDLTLSGAVTGTSRFHVSCSDSGMDGTEHCGLPQGNSKNNDVGFINQWLLDGMTGESGGFECGLTNTGVVAPEVSSPTGPIGPIGAVVTGAANLDLGDDKKVKWELTNNGTVDVFITEVLVTWPSEHNELVKFKFAGDFAKNVNDTSSPTSVPNDKSFESDANKRKLKDGDNEKLEIEFEDGFKNHQESDYTITVTFDNGDILTFPTN